MYNNTMYKHPHEVININDNSEIKENSVVNSGPNLFSIIVSDSGIDNKIQTFKDRESMLREHGSPNIRDHGQSYYQCLNWLENGGVVKSMRISAKNSTYSNLLIMLSIKIRDQQKTNAAGEPLYLDPVSGAETTESVGTTPIMIKKAKVKLVGESFTELNDIERDLDHLVRGKYDNGSTPGEYLIPLYLFTCKGRGKYGDAFRLRLTPNYSRDRDMEKNRYYMFELLNNKDGLSRVELPLSVSSNPEAKTVEKKSEYITDVIKRNLYPIGIFTIDEFYDKAISLLFPIISQTQSGLISQDIDFLFFTDKNGEPYENIEIDPETLNLSAYEGYPLYSGSDGDFDRSVVDRFNFIYDRVIEAFEGKIDSSVLDTKKMPVVVCLDANYPLEVKKAMEVWKASRKSDSLLILDCGLSYTLLDLKTIRNTELTSDEYSTAILSHHMNVNDKYTGKEITVTEPYLYSITLPRHIKSKGAVTPMAGVEVPLNDLIVPDTIRPIISKPEDKTDFYQLRLNYMEEEFDTITFATQVTSQIKTTSLSYINNVLVLQEVVRTVQRMAPILRYKPNETEEDIAYFNRIVNKELEVFEHSLKRMEAIVSKSKDPNMPRKLSVRIVLVFKSYTEIIEFDIDVER